MTKFEKTIRKRMIDKEVRITDIAKALGISSSAASYFVKGIAKSQRFDTWVHENLGLDLEELREETVAV